MPNYSIIYPKSAFPTIKGPIVPLQPKPTSRHIAGLGLRDSRIDMSATPYDPSTPKLPKAPELLNPKP